MNIFINISLIISCLHNQNRSIFINIQPFGFMIFLICLASGTNETSGAFKRSHSTKKERIPVYLMNKILIILLLMMIPLSSCATLSSMDGDTQESIEKKDNPVLWRKVNNLENHAINSQVNTGAIHNEIKKLNQELNTTKEKIKTLQEQLQQLMQEIENEKIPSATKGKNAMPRLSVPPEQQRLMEKKTTEPSVAQQTRQQVIKDKKDNGKGVQNLQIKILSGDGRQESAEKMKNKLTGMGYPVRMVDLAPRKNFEANAVFFAVGYREQAEEIAKKIGGNIPIKPISWHSVFNIIIVSAQ
jgi:hypothetical protein